MSDTRFIHALKILLNCLEEDEDGPVVRYPRFWAIPEADRETVRVVWKLPEFRLHQLVRKVREPLLRMWLDAIDADSWDYLYNNGDEAIALHASLEHLDAVLRVLCPHALLDYRRP